MEVKAKDVMLAVTVEASPDEFTELDEELNRIYKLVGNDNIANFSKLWELKDKLIIALKG